MGFLKGQTVNGLVKIPATDGLDLSIAGGALGTHVGLKMPNTLYWTPRDSSNYCADLQALIDSITDMAWNKRYVIVIPGGEFNLGGGTISLKQNIFLVGQGGQNQITQFSNGYFQCNYAQLSGSGTVGLKGIRFNNYPITFDMSAGTAGGYKLTVFLEDCYFPTHAYVRACGISYAERDHLVIYMRDCWHQNNTAAQSSFLFCKLFVYQSEFHMLNYVDIEAYFNNCRLKSNQMADVTAANWKGAVQSSGGYLVYSGCSEENWDADGPSLFHHLGANWANSPTLWVTNGIIKGDSTPGGDVGLEGSARYEIGTLYADAASGKLYIKSAAVGTDTWTEIT